LRTPDVDDGSEYFMMWPRNILGISCNHNKVKKNTTNIFGTMCECVLKSPRCGCTNDGRCFISMPSHHNDSSLDERGTSYFILCEYI